MEESLPQDESECFRRLQKKYDSLLWSFTLFVGATLVLFGVLATKIVLLIPYFERIFAEMLDGAVLPLLTVKVIEFSRGAGFGLIPLLCAVVVPAAIALFSAFKFRDSKVGRYFVLGVWAYLLLIVILFPIGLILPLLSILKSFEVFV